jgi:hypothetical protein
MFILMFEVLYKCIFTILAIHPQSASMKAAEVERDQGVVFAATRERRGVTAA